jgi:hypothetical protein
MLGNFIFQILEKDQCRQNAALASPIIRRMHLRVPDESPLHRQKLQVHRCGMFGTFPI